MTAALNLGLARAAAEALMLSTCTITRAGGKPVWNQTTGTYTDPPALTVYSGRCKLQDADRNVGQAAAGERELAISKPALHLPIDGSGNVRRGDVARIDSNPLDPSAVGSTFVIQGPHIGSAKTARRLPLEAVV